MADDLFNDRDAARKVTRAAYRAANKEKRAAYNAAWKAANPHKRAETLQRWKAANPDYYKRYWADPANREKHRLRERARRERLTEAEKAQITAKRSEYQKRNRQKINEYNRAWYKAVGKRPQSEETKEIRTKKRAIYRARPEVKERVRAKKAAYYANPEVKQRALARRRSIYQTVLGNLRLRMSSAVRYSLKSAGKSAKWLDLVGYTTAELRRHLERQFLRGMNWDNMAKWHIDHIVPLASFRFETADDPEFKAAWALTNLRPLWGPDNVRKQAKREHLV